MTTRLFRLQRFPVSPLATEDGGMVRNSGCSRFYFLPNYLGPSDQIFVGLNLVHCVLRLKQYIKIPLPPCSSFHRDNPDDQTVPVGENHEVCHLSKQYVYLMLATGQPLHEARPAPAWVPQSRARIHAPVGYTTSTGG